VAAGADLVEFDVVDGLLVDHPGEARPDDPPALDDALAYLAGQEIGVHIHLKQEGIEPEGVAPLHRHGLADRVLVSSTKVAALRRLADADPALTRAISYPHDRYGAAGLPWPKPVVRSAAVGLRPAMRVRLPLLLTAARAQVLSVRH